MRAREKAIAAATTRNTLPARGLKKRAAVAIANAAVA